MSLVAYMRLMVAYMRYLRNPGPEGSPSAPGHGIYSTMERHGEDYRATIARALGGRSVAGSAIAHGLPRDAIRRVLRGHDPRLSRADDICRALGITFTLGKSKDGARRTGRTTVSWLSDSVPAGGGSASSRMRSVSIPVRDPRLAEILGRLAEHWNEIEGPERDRLAAGIAAILEISDASTRRR